MAFGPQPPTYRTEFLCGSLLLLVALYCETSAFGTDAGVYDELGCDGKWAQSPLCVERSRALDTRAKIEAILSSLTAVRQPPWPRADLAAARSLYDEGVALFSDEYFGDAAAKFEPALSRLDAIQNRFEDLLADTVSEAEQRLAVEDFVEALSGFRRVLGWKPDHQIGLIGVARAETGQRIERIATQAIALVEAGEADRAEALLDSITTDYQPSALRKARNALRDFDARTRLRAQITAGHAALDRMDWAAAAGAFRSALSINAQSTAAQDGLAQAQRRASESKLASLRQSLAMELAQEFWTDSIDTVREIAKLEPDAPEVCLRLAELERLASLESRLDRALADPRRAAAKNLREDTRALIDATKNRSLIGERIYAKGQQLERQFGKWTITVPLTIRSDNKTEIHMRPGRKLGRFRTTNLKVYPGDYTVVARRNGFREKKLALSVRPDSQPIVVELVCDERF